jgi:hypothetical protein
MTQQGKEPKTNGRWWALAALALSMLTIGLEQSRESAALTGGYPNVAVAAGHGNRPARSTHERQSRTALAGPVASLLPRRAAHRHSR